MAEEAYPDIDPNAVLLEQQVLELGRVTRASQLANRLALVEQAEIARVRLGSPEVQLAGEVEALQARMAWLYEHPRLQRFIGRSAINIIHKSNRYNHIPDTLSTAPLHDGDIAALHGEHLLYSGLVFWTFYEKHRSAPTEIEIDGRVVKVVPDRSHRTLYIEQQVRDETTGESGRRRLFDLYAHDSTTGPRVQIHGGGFSDYAARMRRQIFEEYAREHEDVDRLFMHYSDYPGLSSGRRQGHFQTHGLDWKDIVKAEQLNHELAPRMEAGGDWEYPEEMFLEPLALVRQMNILLGTKKLKEK